MIQFQIEVHSKGPVTAFYQELCLKHSHPIKHTQLYCYSTLKQRGHLAFCMNNKFGIFSTNDSIVIKVIVCQYRITWSHYYQIRWKITPSYLVISLYHKSCKNHFSIHWSGGPNNNINTVRWCIAFTFTKGHVTYRATAWTIDKYTRLQLMAFTGANMPYTAQTEKGKAHQAGRRNNARPCHAAIRTVPFPSIRGSHVPESYV